MKCLLLIVTALFSTVALAQQHIVKQTTFDAIAGEFSGERAQEHIRFIVDYHRIQGSPMMANVAADVVQRRLKAIGVESSVDQYTSDGKTMYGTYVSPMGWDMRGGELWVTAAGAEKNFQPIRLCRYSDVPMCVATYSKGGEWSGELVDVGSGVSDKDYDGKDVRGKVALASAYAADVVRAAVIQRGAVGVVIYPMADDRPEHPDMVRYNGIWPTADEIDKTSGGFMISLNQYAMLQRMMAAGPVRVRGKIDASLAPGKLTLVHAYIKGTEHPEQEVLISAHLDHPKWSANDNASGSAALMEMARTLTTLIDAKKIAPPARTIHLMWVPEIYGTMAYLTNHKEARRCGDWDDPRHVEKWDPTKHQPCTVANLNMDMVGEDTVKTNGRFYFTRTPASVPSFLDVLLEDILDQTKDAHLFAGAGTHNYWPTESIPITLGSDHEPFLGLGIPASMLGHDPDWTHHTSEDTVDKTDASELLRVGAMASAAAYWIASATTQDWNNIGRQATVLNDSRLKIAWANGTLPSGHSVDEIAKGINARMTLPQASAATQSGSGYHRLQTVPLNSKVMFIELSTDDRKWWDAQDQRFAARRDELLPRKPTLDVFMWETLNLMDGHRSAAEIGDILSAEFAANIDAAWVQKMAGILEKKHLVAK
jgi:hypothetical protein